MIEKLKKTLCPKCKLHEYCQRLPEQRPDWIGRMWEQLRDMKDGPAEGFEYDMQCEKYPIYRHRCSTCEFMARIIVKGIKYDVYRCGDTWLARYNDDEGGYWSMPEEMILKADMSKATLLLQMMRARVEEANNARLDTPQRSP